MEHGAPAVCKEDKKTAGGHSGFQPKPVLFQWPTRLADGLGLKELPRPVKDYTPVWWFPRSSLTGRENSASLRLDHFRASVHRTLLPVSWSVASRDQLIELPVPSDPPSHWERAGEGLYRRSNRVQ